MSFSAMRRSYNTPGHTACTPRRAQEAGSWREARVARTRAPARRRFRPRRCRRRAASASAARQAERAPAAARPHASTTPADARRAARLAVERVLGGPAPFVYLHLGAAAVDDDELHAPVRGARAVAGARFERPGLAVAHRLE